MGWAIGPYATHLAPPTIELGGAIERKASGAHFPGQNCKKMEICATLGKNEPNNFPKGLAGPARGASQDISRALSRASTQGKHGFSSHFSRLPSPVIPAEAGI